MQAPEGGPAERLSLTMSSVGLALQLAPRRA
jgi:hypothetical protein